MDYEVIAFNRGELRLPREALLDCHHQGRCDDDVEFWHAQIDWDAQTMTADDIRDELFEYGAWDATELANIEANQQRILWLAAGDYQERLYSETR